MTKIKKKGSMACLEIFSGKLEAYHIIVRTCPSKDVTKYSRVCELSILLTRKKGYHVWGGELSHIALLSKPRSRKRHSPVPKQTKGRER